MVGDERISSGIAFHMTGAAERKELNGSDIRHHKIMNILTFMLATSSSVSN